MIAIKPEVREQNNWTKVSTDTFVSSVRDGCQGRSDVVKTRFRDDYQVETGGERLSNCALQGFVSFEFSPRFCFQDFTNEFRLCSGIQLPIIPLGFREVSFQMRILFANCGPRPPAVNCLESAFSVNCPAPGGEELKLLKTPF
jgi:hypothetical protein